MLAQQRCLQQISAVNITQVLRAAPRPCYFGVGQAKQYHQHRSSSTSGNRSLQLQAYAPGDYSRASAGPSNLGELQRVIEVDPTPEDPYGMQRVSPDRYTGNLIVLDLGSYFSSRGFYTDAPSIIGSLVLLLVLLALTFQRILGLDRFITKALKSWQESREYARRTDVLKARQMLEKNWTKDDS